MKTLDLKIQIIVSDVSCCRITIYKRTRGPGAVAGLVKFGEIVAEFAVGVDKPFLESWISIVCDEGFDMLLETTETVGMFCRSIDCVRALTRLMQLNLHLAALFPL
jgi:hypothetical protein